MKKSCVKQDGYPIKKTDLVREAVAAGNMKKALSIAKDFRLGISKEQRSLMTRAYECLVHPAFYTSIGIDLSQAIQDGISVVNSLYQ